MIKLGDLLNDVQLNESVRDRGIFKVVFFSGVPGAGKSYVLKNVTDGTIEPRIVNTDKYTEFLSSKVGHDISGEFDTYVDEIKRVTLDQLTNYVNGGLPMFVDGTSNNPSALLKRDGILKSFGYDTGMIWINTDLDVAMERIKGRTRKVPDEFVKNVFASLSRNKEYYKSQFKFFIEINNNRGELTDSVINDAFKKVGGFYRSELMNPIGVDFRKKMEQSNGYMVPAIFGDIKSIKRRLVGWYN
jgi:predicted kinase